MALRLCGVSVSPYFERVFLALDMKGATKHVEYPGVPGGFKSDEHFKNHPLGKIPFLIKEDGTSLTESQVIMEYLDSVLDGPKLVPEDPADRADASALARIFDIYFYHAQRPFGSAYFGGPDTEEDMRKAREEEMLPVLNYIEKYIGTGDRAIGDYWTTADAVLISQLYWFDRIGEKYDMPSLTDYPKLNAYWENVKVTEMARRSFERVGKSYDQFFGGNK